MSSHRRTWQALAVALLAGVALTLIFWLPLWRGGGFVGGDIYSYFFPQKTYYAQSLKGGELPFWHNLTGHGYPLVAESQTGVFYPVNLLLYSTLDVHTAYHAGFLLHYVLAVLFAFAYARRISLGSAAALFAAVVYTYSWFPPRSCVEWAIIGGAWLPAALWAAEAYLQTGRWRFAFMLSGVLAVQLLAGHFEIAFFTLLVLAVYVPARLFWATVPGRAAAKRRRGVDAFLLGMAVLCGLGLAAVQLVPTWELKTRSQRAEGTEHEVGFGSIPVWYLSQTFAPWYWYGPPPLADRNALLEQDPPAYGYRTNEVEAHLYFGIVPLLLALWNIAASIRARDRLCWLWTGLGFAALVYATGWLVPLGERLPGFSYFQGPGRFGVITTLAVAVLAARCLQSQILAARIDRISIPLVACVAMLLSLVSSILLVSDVELVESQFGIPSSLTFGDGTSTLSTTVLVRITIVILLAASLALLPKLRGTRRTEQGGGRVAPAGRILYTCLFACAVLNLWVVSRLITFTPMVSRPPLTFLSESPVREQLARHPQPVRLFAPGANFPNVLGVASTPAYLTFGPAQYADPALTMPQPPAQDDDATHQSATPEQIDWLRRAGVTHVLSFKPLDPISWPARQVWTGDDPLLNRAWARAGEPLFLSRLEGSRGRVAWERAQEIPVAEAGEFPEPRVVRYAPNQVVIEAETPVAARLVLTDLFYPGWEVRIDGRPATPEPFEGMYRSVLVPPGKHTVVWNYVPRGLYWGAGISLAIFIFLAAVAHARFWHPAWFKTFERSRQP